MSLQGRRACQRRKGVMALLYETLPTVQEMLRTCSHERMADVLVSQYVAEGGRRRERVRTHYREVIERMCSASVDEPCGIVIVPRVRFECSPSFSITRWVQAMCVDVANHGARLGSIGVEPWERVLSFGVWPGSDACLRDRYALLADACWSMACAGTTAREARVRSSLRAGEPLRPQWMGSSESLGARFGGSDLVDDEYREVMNELVDGWNADADVAFYAETLAMRRFVRAA